MSARLYVSTADPADPYVRVQSLTPGSNFHATLGVFGAMHFQADNDESRWGKRPAPAYSKPVQLSLL